VCRVCTIAYPIANNFDRQDGLHRAQALDIPTRLSNTVVTPCPPPLPLENHRILEGSQLSVSPGGASPQSPRWIPPPGSGSGQDSAQGSPLSGAFVSQARTDLESQKQNSDTVLQPPRDYCVAKMLVSPISDTKFPRLVNANYTTVASETKRTKQ
jgi:hypothetical protein